MAIRVTCESCDHEFTTRDDNAGRRVRCPECREPVAVSAKRKGKSKKSSGGNQTALIAAIAGGVVAVAAIVIAVVVTSGRGGNNVAPNNNAAPPVAANAPAAVGTPPNAVAPNAGAPGGMVPPTATPTAPGSTPMPTVAGVPEGNPSAPGLTALGPGNTPLPMPNASGTPLSPMPTASNAPATNLPAAATNPVSAPSGPEFSLADLIEKCEPSVVRIDVRDAEGGGNGSGFVIDKTGIIVTNYHVIAGSSTAVCFFKDGSQANVEGFLSIDPQRDVAIIKVNHPAEKLHPIPLAATLPRKGEKVVAFGAPLGLSWTATDGVVSAFRSQPELANLGIQGIAGDWIQTSTPISPGNSGGPLVNFRGEVVAMNTMQLTIGQNLNFAIQAKEIDVVLSQSKSATLTALAPKALPKAAKSRAPQIVDATKDERGRKALGRLKEVTLLTIMSRDPTGRIRAIVTKKAVDTVRQLGLLVRDGDESDNATGLAPILFGTIFAQKKFKCRVLRDG